MARGILLQQCYTFFSSSSKGMLCFWSLRTGHAFYQDVIFAIWNLYGANFTTSDEVLLFHFNIWLQYVKIKWTNSLNLWFKWCSYVRYLTCRGLDFMYGCLEHTLPSGSGLIPKRWKHQRFLRQLYIAPWLEQRRILSLSIVLKDAIKSDQNAPRATASPSSKRHCEWPHVHAGTAEHSNIPAHLSSSMPFSFRLIVSPW